MTWSNNRINTDPRMLVATLLVSALLWPGVVHANAGLPMLLVVWPFALAGIIPVILVEAWIVQRGTGIPWRVSLWEMSKANLVSTLVGLPLTWIALVALEFLAGYLLVNVAKAESFPPRWLGEVGVVVMSAPWLGPFRTGGHWIIPVATATLLVPFFFVSAWVEALTVRKVLAASGNSNWRRVIWRANLISYGILFVATLIWLLVGLAAHDWSGHAIRLS